MQVTAPDRDELRRLAEVRLDRPIVLSLYLDLDPAQFATPPARATAIRSLLDEAERRLRERDGLAFHLVVRDADAIDGRLQRGSARRATGSSSSPVTMRGWPRGSSGPSKPSYRGVRATCGDTTTSDAPAAVISGRACCRASSSALQYGHQRPR